MDKFWHSEHNPKEPVSDYDERLLRMQKILGPAENPIITDRMVRDLLYCRVGSEFGTITRTMQSNDSLTLKDVLKRYEKGGEVRARNNNAGVKSNTRPSLR